MRWCRTRSSQISAAQVSKKRRPHKCGTRSIARRSGSLKTGQNGSLLNWR
jgi:hypothetical protein